MTNRPFPFRAASRWTALAAAAVVLLFAASVQAAEKNPEYTSLAGVKTEGIQKWLDDAKSQGYVPIYLNGCTVGDHVEFGGVAVKDPTVEQVEYRLNLNEDEYDEFAKDMTKKGFRPGPLSGYMAGKGIRFATLWRKDNNKAPHPTPKINLTVKQFEDTIADMRKKGMDPHGTSAYRGADGAVRYIAGFTERGKGQHWEERHDLTADDYQTQLDHWSSNDYKLSSVHVYETPDGTRFMATAVKEDGDSFMWQERHGITGEQYQKTFDKLGEDGYRPRSICEYLEDGKPHFAITWIKYNKK